MHNAVAVEYEKCLMWHTIHTINDKLHWVFVEKYCCVPCPSAYHAYAFTQKIASGRVCEDCIDLL